MRTRTALAAAAAALVAAGSLVPALAAGSTKEIKGSWTADAFPPEPSGGGHCAPKIAQARDSKTWTVPGPGTFTMTLNNKLDWSADLRTSKDDVLSEADGNLPHTPEGLEWKFTKKTAIVMGACNLGGEPSVTVSWSFRPKKK